MPITVYCVVCGSEIKRRRDRILRSRSYCSYGCMSVGYKTNKPLRCIICGKEFYCSQSQERLRSRKTCSKQCKAKMMEVKYLGSKTDRKGLIHALQQEANMYARLRDCKGKNGSAPCISCGVVFPYEKLDGGHFIPTTSSSVRFDERNINAQCWKCNRYLSGNGRHYLKGMVSKYGQEVVDELESLEFSVKKWSIEEIALLRQEYKDKIKTLEQSQLPSEQ